jgi:2-polyprenyl-6-methoxyphenol hydroxylase-like FAD-dependent oxidoreductase
MTSVCINGAGFAGLATALLLAADGRDVTVIDRDPAPPCGGPEMSWASWDRRAVRQFRQTHAYLGLARLLIRRELPRLWTRLLEAGITEHNLATHPPAGIQDRSPAQATMTCSAFGAAGRQSNLYSGTSQRTTPASTYCQG